VKDVVGKLLVTVGKIQIDLFSHARAYSLTSCLSNTRDPLPSQPPPTHPHYQSVVRISLRMIHQLHIRMTMRTRMMASLQHGAPMVGTPATRVMFDMHVKCAEHARKVVQRCIPM